MPSDNPERRHDYSQIVGELGEIRGTLRTFMDDYAQTSRQVREDLQSRTTSDAERWVRIEERLTVLSSWKNQMTGGMTVAVMLWRIWATVVSLAIGALSYARLH